MKVAIFSDTYYPHINGVSSAIDRQMSGFLTYGDQFILVGPASLSVTFPVATWTVYWSADERYSLQIPRTWPSDITPALSADVIHIHTPFAFGCLGLLCGRLAKAQSRARIVYTHHTNFREYLHYTPLLNNCLGKYLSSSYVRWFAANVDIVTVPSQATAHSLIAAKVPPVKIKLLPTPLDTLYLDSPPEVQNKIYDVLFVGRLAKEKNIDLLIDVYRWLLTIRAELRLAIVGDGIQREYLISKLAPYQGINIIGEVQKSDMINIFRNSRLLFAPSTSETQGLTIQEAWSQGVPVVGIECSQTKEYVVHDHNGWLFPPDGSLIARSIVRFLNGDAVSAIRQNCINSAQSLEPAPKNRTGI